LIATLKADVAAQTILAKDSSGLKKKLESQKSEIASLQAQLAETTLSLSEVQSENKILSAKLAANRTAAASVESANTRVPNSAVKANGGIRMMGSAEAAQVAQAAQLKEDIYSDLTGLIIRSVKREAEEDVFDCIQTGRNGSKSWSLPVPQIY
jgi:septal ring factor EnvC (AmiA/AmiB activator)